MDPTPKKLIYIKKIWLVVLNSITEIQPLGIVSQQPGFNIFVCKSFVHLLLQQLRKKDTSILSGILIFTNLKSILRTASVVFNNLPIKL